MWRAAWASRKSADMSIKTLLGVGRRTIVKLGRTVELRIEPGRCMVWAKYSDDWICQNCDNGQIWKILYIIIYIVACICSRGESRNGEAYE